MKTRRQTCTSRMTSRVPSTPTSYPLFLVDVLMSRRRVLYRFVYAWGSAFTDAVGFHEAESRGLMGARWAFWGREVLTTSFLRLFIIVGLTKSSSSCHALQYIIEHLPDESFHLPGPLRYCTCKWTKECDVRMDLTVPKF
jgi:hypothetical protein